MPRRNHRTKPGAARPLQPASCSDKRSFASRAAAERAIAERTDVDVQLRCYLCTNCGKWHLTSQER